MNVDIEFPPASEIIAYLDLEPTGATQYYFTMRARHYMDKYVPMENGDLRTNVEVQRDEIDYMMPYAHAQYVGFTKGPVKNYTTAGTGPYWDLRMASVDGQKLVDEVAKFNKEQYL